MPSNDPRRMARGRVVSNNGSPPLDPNSPLGTGDSPRADSFQTAYSGAVHRRQSSQTEQSGLLSGRPHTSHGEHSSPEQAPVRPRPTRPFSFEPASAAVLAGRPETSYTDTSDNRPGTAHTDLSEDPAAVWPDTSYSRQTDQPYSDRPPIPPIPMANGHNPYFDAAVNRSTGQLSTHSQASDESWSDLPRGRWNFDRPSPSGDFAIPSGDSQYSWRDSIDSPQVPNVPMSRYSQDSRRNSSATRPAFPSQTLFPPDSTRNSSMGRSQAHTSMLSAYSGDSWRESSVNNPHLSTLLGISAPWRDSRISGSSGHRMSTFSGFSADSGQGQRHLLQPGAPPLQTPKDKEFTIKRKDIKKQPSRKRTQKKPKDPNLVSWDGPNDPNNPRNWSMKRKWAAVLVVSSFTFITPVSSSIVAPALEDISRDLNIKSDIEIQMCLSIFVLAYAIGPLLLAPLSEIYGRVYVLQGANLFYFCWNLGCGFAQTRTQMIVFRFLSGLGGSAPLAVGGGVLSDCFVPEQRGRAISVYALAPLLGPAIGPIAGGFIAQYTTWRWIFWATSAADVLIQISGFFFLQETYHPKLLKNKADKLREETGNKELHTEYEQRGKSLAKVIRTAAIRPFRLLTTQPIVQVIACYVAFLYGMMYLLLSTFPRLWTGVYGESVSIGALNYISLGLGFGVGTQIAAPINDRIYRKLKVKNDNKRKPEFRIPLVFLGSCFVPIGLFWYGWSAQLKAHWIMPNIGCAIFGAGTIVNFQCMQGYIVDSYTRYAASGIAATVVLRSLAGFGFPLFAPYMYRALDYGWGNTLLGFLALCIGLPSPFLFWFYGERLRKKSTYAAGGDFK